MRFSHSARRVLRWRGIRFLLALLALAVAVILRDIIVDRLATAFAPGITLPQVWLGPGRPGAVLNRLGAIYSVAAFGVMVLLGFGAYWLHSRWVERRSPVEFGTRGAGRELALGAFIGFALVLVVAGILAAFGYFRVTGTNPWIAVVPALMTAATAAYMEELALRGILFRIIEERLGTWITLAITSALFGGLHAANPRASWMSTVTIAVAAGVVLGAAYVVTRRLWLPIGLHFAVNAAQGAVLGLAVSGTEKRGLFVSELSGPPILSGGAFGIEASVLVLVIGLVVGVVLLHRAGRLGHIKSPFWGRAV